jgi:hypothetical protein
MKMGELFGELCKGPVVVVDDKIGDSEDLINKLIREIKENNLPVLEYKSIGEVRKELVSLFFSNFMILDWKIIGGEDGSRTGASIGYEAEAVTEQEVIKFIKEFRKICLAPIFVLTAYNKSGVISKLKTAGIITEGRNYVFVEHKNVLCATTGTLISKIEDWIKESPHIYLAKCFTNEWLSKNTRVFWDLFDLNPNWPNVFYKSFKEDGEDPISGLNDVLFRLVKAKTNLNNIDDKILKRAAEDSNIDKIKELYGKIMYLEENIDDIKPGDIYKKGQKYYINIRPECDTTKRENNEDVVIYLIPGTKISDTKVKEEFYKIHKENKKEHGAIIPKVNEEILPFLDGKNFIRFRFKDLKIKEYSEMRDKKKCRLIPPFITHLQHRYSSFLGRYGIPKVPQEVYDEIFGKNKNEKETAHKKK